MGRYGVKVPHFRTRVAWQQDKGKTMTARGGRVEKCPEVGFGKGA